MNRDQEKQFDEQIRQRMTEWQSAASPKGWEKLASELEQGEHPFDKAIREKIEVLPASALPSAQNWDALAQKIDQQDSDRIYHQKLRQVAVPTYQQGGWVRLAARLELIAQRRSAILAYKITEYALLLSALLIFWQYHPTAPTATPLPLAQSVATTQRQVVLNEAIDVAALTFNQQESPTTGQESRQNSSETPPQLNLAHVTTPLPPNSTALLSSLGSTAERMAQRMGEQLKNQAASLPVNDQAAFTALTTEVVDPLATHSLQQLKQSQRPLAAPISTLAKSPTSGQHFLRLFISPSDINQIVTPAFLVGERKIDRDVRFSSGRSAGLLLDVFHGKHGHSYGLIYSRRSYLPTVFADAESARNFPRPSPLARVDTNYSRIIFQTVSLPFNYQRTLTQSGKWKLRANAGVELNLVLKAKFYKSPNFDNNITDFIRNAGGGNSLARSSDLRELKASDLIHPEKGLMQGGSALLNTSFYVGGGLTLERETGLRSSLFISPQFTRAVYYRRQAGLGPFGDRIHHNSLQVGMRWRLD